MAAAAWAAYHSSPSELWLAVDQAFTFVHTLPAESVIEVRWLVAPV